MTNEERLVEEYAFIAKHVHESLGPYTSHEEYARDQLRLGREMQLRLRIRKLWGKD